VATRGTVVEVGDLGYEMEWLPAWGLSKLDQERRRQRVVRYGVAELRVFAGKSDLGIYMEFVLHLTLRGTLGGSCRNSMSSFLVNSNAAAMHTVFHNQIS